MQQNYLFSLLLLLTFALPLSAQNSRWAVEVGAYADRVPLTYFKKLDKKVYETLDVNQIYRYYVDANDQAQAEQIRTEAKTAGCPYARVVDFDYLREVCASQCGYTPRNVTKTALPNQPNQPNSNDKDMTFEVRDKMSIQSGNKKGQPYEDPNSATKISKESDLKGGIVSGGLRTYEPDYEGDISNTELISSFSERVQSYLSGREKTTFTQLQDDDKLLRVEWIFFGFDRSALRYKSRQELGKVAYMLKKYPSFTIELHAHTDGKGSIAYNEKLSARRANAAKKYLLRLGIPANRISSREFGKSKPIAANETNAVDTPAGRQFNRRVEIRILDAQGQAVDVVDIIQIPADLQPK